MLAAAATVSSNPFIQQLLVEQLLAGYETAAGQASALTDYYNQMEEKGLEQHGGNIARADINGLFKEILANPQAFGLTNTVGMACPPGVSASACSSAMPGFNASQDYLFADHLHPGPQVHTIIAQYIQSIIAAPVQATYLNQSVQSMAQGSRTTLDSRYQQLRQGENPVGSLGMFGGYSGGYQRYDNNEADGNGNHNNLTVGVDYQLNEQVLLGGLIAVLWISNILTIIIVMTPAVFRPPYSAICAPVRRGWIAIYTTCPLNSVTFSAVSRSVR